MTTLRRELRTTFASVLSKYFSAFPATPEATACLLDDLADAALKMRAFSTEAPKNLGLDWKIAAGLEVTEADLARERDVSQATAEFERALMVCIPWGKESKFMAWVAEQYAKDSTCFARYAKWQKDDPYHSQSAKQIRRDPAQFMDTWPAFEATHKPPVVDDRPDPELERLRREAEMPWSKPPERK